MIETQYILISISSMPAKGAFPWPSLIGSAVSTPRPTNSMHGSSSSCGVSRYGGFLKWGYPKSSISMDFPWNKPSILGYPMEPPISRNVGFERICCSTSKTILTPHKLRGAFGCLPWIASRDRCVKDVPYPCYPFCSVIQRKRWESYTRLSNIINISSVQNNLRRAQLHSKMIIWLVLPRDARVSVKCPWVI